LDPASAIVYIVDDDEWVRRALERLIGASGYKVSAFGSATEFLAAHDADCDGCLILDMAMPDFGGLDVQRILNESGGTRAIIFLTGCGSIASSVQAMKSGAITFLTKPIAGSELVAVIREAVEVDHALRIRRATQEALYKRMSSLTRRERQVLEHLVEGRLNKQTAAALGTSEQTVKVHRARVMRKMCARSVAELVCLVANSEPIPPRLPLFGGTPAEARGARL
jgi:FixJ family two-component response regulator